ncbi:related to transmembrane protein 19 [Fusarium torulosum]|uniref:Related to transmembrane protein 19 n=1 Tax=Fusarium torulosum TaxID=33205 RepID=A0AAE8MLU5_9HYPO|nr:related to transmembrane protein 19 [Fusarium torulosum]
MRLLYAFPATCALIYRAKSRNSLTPAGIFAATLTAVAHAYHPWNLPFALLCVFFLAGTRVTHIKEGIKSNYTLRSKGTSGGEGPRTHVQVLANSLMASVLSLLHANQLRKRETALADPNTPDPTGSLCFSWGGDLLVVGIIANYAAVAADTFSSELGILSTGQPRLITSPTLRKVPRGTNGGVTLLGLGAGLLGSMIIVTTSMLFLPSCNEESAHTPAGGAPWTMLERRKFMGFMVLWGALGSVLDSFLGGLFQRSVKDVRSGKIVEGEGGNRVLVTESAEDAAAHAKKANAKAAAMQSQGTMAEEKLHGSAIADDDDAHAGVYDPKDKHRKSSFGDQRPSRAIENGWDLLDNNDVNFLMAVVMSVGGMAAAGWYWDVPIQSVMGV